MERRGPTPMEYEAVYPLPVMIDRIDDESGLSFIFRALQANGLSFLEAMHWLGLKRWYPLRWNEVSALAWVTHAEHSWLQSRVVVLTPTRNTARHYEYMGHTHGEGTVDFIYSRKICPKCFKRNKYHRFAWQLRAVCGCIEHDMVLADRCPVCQRLIGWNRPAIDVCCCGSFLTIMQETQPLAGGVANWIRWAEYRLANQQSLAHAADFDLPFLLESLSLDGAFRVVFAFGLLPSGNSSTPQALAYAKTSIGMNSLISRGISRLHALGQELKNIVALRQTIYEPALERMKITAIDEADTHCAGLILEYLRLGSMNSPEKRGRYRRGQLSLF